MRYTPCPECAAESEQTGLVHYCSSEECAPEYYAEARAAYEHKKKEDKSSSSSSVGSPEKGTSR